MANSYTDYLLAAGVPGLWVRLRNNYSSTDYYSTAATDTNGAFTHTAPPGDYALYTGSSATVVGTPNLRNAHYAVPVRSGDDPAFNSVTTTISPYAPSANAKAGGAVFGQTYILAPPPSGGDDTAVLAALVASGNVFLQLQGGTYTLSGHGIVLFSNSTLAGVGPDTILLLNSNSAYNPAFTVTIGNNVNNLISNVTIRDIYFDGNERSMTYTVGAQHAPLYGEGSGDYVAPVHEGICTGLIGAGFDGGQTYNLKVLNCTFVDWARDSIAMGTARNVTGQIDHTDTLIQGCTFKDVAYCSTFESMQRMEFIGNSVNGLKMSDPSGSTGYALDLNFRDLRDINIVGNSFDGNGAQADGVRFSDTRQGGNVVITDVVIANNSFRNFSGSQARTTAAINTALRASIIGNSVVSNHTRYGIYALDNCQVIGNYVALNDLVGICLGGNNITMVGNVVRGNNRANSGTGYLTCGLLLGDPLVPDVTTDCLITGNQVFDDQAPQQQNALGVGIAAVTNVSMSGNDFSGNLSVNGSFFYVRGMGGTGNVIRNNRGLNYDTVQSPAFAASFTPDYTTGGVIAIGALTANITINAPVNQGNAGQILTFIFTQDGTGGRTITWNAVYKTAWQPGYLPNGVSLISFVFDGTNWQQWSGPAVDTLGDLFVAGGTLFFTNTSATVRPGATQLGFVNNANTAFNLILKDGGSVVLRGDLQRSRQTPTEAVLVSGINATTGEIISVTLTAARLVGAPLNPATGQNLTFELTQGGAGGFAVTWNAVFKKTWADTGNTTGKISSISFYYNGTNWVQTGAQAPYV